LSHENSAPTKEKVVTPLKQVSPLKKGLLLPEIEVRSGNFKNLKTKASTQFQNSSVGIQKFSLYFDFKTYFREEKTATCIYTSEYLKVNTITSSSV